jgi:hypothetical protein
MKLQKIYKECCFGYCGKYSVDSFFAGSVWCIFLEMNRKGFCRQCCLPVCWYIYLSIEY